MIYEVRRGPLIRPTVWRLEDGALIEDGRRPRRYALSTLKQARLVQGGGRLSSEERGLVLTFGRRRIAIGSMTYAGLARRADQIDTFALFARALMAQAAEHSPNARFRTAGHGGLGLYGGVMAILGAGLVLVLVATLAAGQYRLGADLGARIAFALILLLTPLPWLGEMKGRSFDPRAIPPKFLA